jgi:uncharacterized protein (UPF0332 family)
VGVAHQDFTDFADRASLLPHEIDWRMAAARAYYAGFHRANLSVRFCPENAHLAMGSHERLTERLKLHGSINAKSMAYILAAMKKTRVVADYEISDDFELSTAKNQLAQYHVLCQKFDSFDEICSEKLA